MRMTKHKPVGKGIYRKKYGIVLIIIIGVLILAAVLILLNQHQKEAPSKWDLVGESIGIVNALGKEEMEFYQPLAQKELQKSGGQTVDSVYLIDYASRVYAQFLIGNKLGLCSPYSLSSLKAEMEQENNLRKARKENGEAIYGPEQYDLDSYFQYRLAEVKEQTIQELSRNPDSKLVEESRAYWNAHQEDFALIEEICYELTANGKTEQKVLTREEMSTLSKTDPQLLDLLYEGEDGQEFEYQFGDELRTGKILSIKKHTVDYEEDRQTVVESYVANVAYPELVKKMADSNPVEWAN